MNDLTPQTDCKLLVMAAEAVGFPNYTVSGNFLFVETGPCRGSSGYYWNPGGDDGDCARMEAALGIHVAWHSDGVVCGLRWAGATELFDDHGGDKQAARRLASLRVAAEHGRAKP